MLSDVPHSMLLFSSKGVGGNLQQRLETKSLVFLCNIYISFDLSS